MDKVTVSKEELLDRLRANRESHIDTFEQTLEDYRTRAIQMLEDHIDRIRKGAVEKVSVVLPPPENYEKEYDRAIAMVEWNVNSTIQLDEYTFTQWVMDEWTWKAKFSETVAMYSQA